MNQFDFFKRFPTENDAIDFIVATKYKMVMCVQSADVCITTSTIRNTIIAIFIVTIAKASFRHLQEQYLNTPILI